MLNFTIWKHLSGRHLHWMDPYIKSFTSSLKFTVLTVAFTWRWERVLWFMCGVCRMKKKKVRKPKSWELCFIWWPFWGLKLGRQALGWLWWNGPKTVSEERPRIYGIFCSKDQVVGISKHDSYLMKTGDLKLMNVVCFVSLFLWMESCKSLCSWKKFFWYSCQLSGASILVFPILNPLRIQVAADMFSHSSLCLLVRQASFLSHTCPGAGGFPPVLPSPTVSVAPAPL